MHNKLGMMIGATLAAGLMAAPAHAAGVKVGTLSCDVQGGWGLVLGSQKDLDCTLTTVKGQKSRYEGDITKLGVDVGYTNAGKLLWAVIAPSSETTPDALEGVYGGVTAGVTAVVGGNLNVLVGGLDKSISLQPISVEGNTGVAIAAGVGGMKLKYVQG